MTVTSDQIPAPWLRALQRATDEHLQALRINERTYAVRSTSNRGTQHLVTVGANGKIEHCSDCKGWEYYTCCKHGAAVAKRLMRERGITVGAVASAAPSLPATLSRRRDKSTTDLSMSELSEAA